jgi:hypothetical protein
MPASRSAARCALGAALAFAIAACAGGGGGTTPTAGPGGPTAPLEPPLPNGIYVSPTGSDSGAGTQTDPLRSLEAGLARLGPGLVLVLLDGTWSLTSPVVVRLAGTPDAWIEIRGARGATATLDASAVDIPWASAYPWVQGAIQVEGSAYVRLRDLHVRRSHLAGINVAASRYVDVVNCAVAGTFASGISAWQGTEEIRVLGNTVTGANDTSLSFRPFTGTEAPHEAISIAGTRGFEVAWNDVHDNLKEAIDVKETSALGVVHHNRCSNNERQGLYVDAWFGVLEDVELRDNVVHHNEVGIAVSSEDGPLTRDVRIHHNLVFDNRGPGLYFSRWGKDNPREDVIVYNNTFYRNGYGRSASGDPDYWLTGGLYLHSTNLRGVAIRDNVFALDRPFEIGYSDDFGPAGPAGRVAIERNLVDDVNTTDFPFYMATWAHDWVWSTTGRDAILADPLFVDPASQDFRPRPGSPAIDAGTGGASDPDGSPLDLGAVPSGASPESFWWMQAFPPVIEGTGSP